MKYFAIPFFLSLAFLSLAQDISGVPKNYVVDLKAFSEKSVIFERSNHQIELAYRGAGGAPAIEYRESLSEDFELKVILWDFREVFRGTYEVLRLDAIIYRVVKEPKKGVTYYFPVCQESHLALDENGFAVIKQVPMSTYCYAENSASLNFYFKIKAI